MSDAPAPIIKPAQRDLPHIWLGYMLAVCSAAFECAEHFINPSSDPDSTPILSTLVSMAPGVYWFFCVWRIHRVLREASGNAYPIGPLKSIAFQLIPIFSLYWSIKWPNQIAARFVSAVGNVRMIRFWPGFVLILADGLDGAASGIDRLKDIPFSVPLLLSAAGWMLSFSVLLYIRSKLDRIVPHSSNRLTGPISQILATRPLRVALSAGLGAAFGYLFLHSLWRFWQHKEAVLSELIGIAVVSVSVLAFLEPLVERVRSNIGISEIHTSKQISRPLAIRLAAFLILVFVSLAHGLLHSFIEHNVAQDVWSPVAVLLRGLMIAGGVTLAWKYGMRCRPPCASRLGVTIAALLWSGSLVLLWALRPLNPASSSVAIIAPVSGRTHGLWDSVIQIGIHVGTLTFPAASQLGSSSLQEGEVAILVSSLPWVLAALAGGWFVTPRWRSHPYLGIVAALLAAVLLVDWARMLLQSDFSGAELGDDLAVAVGWSLGLIIIGPAGDVALGARDVEPFAIMNPALVSTAATRTQDGWKQAV
jgi:hypothetical protein